MRSCSISEVALELVRGHIAQRGMQPVPIVDAFQKVADARGGVFQIAVFVAVHLFVLQRLDERLAEGVGPH